jgi:hypothetical protein
MYWTQRVLTKVTPSNHNSVRSLNDLLQVWNRVVALHFGNDLNDLIRPRCHIALQVVDHIRILHKGHRNEIYAFLDGKINVQPVLRNISTWNLRVPPLQPAPIRNMLSKELQVHNQCILAGCRAAMMRDNDLQTTF